MTGTFARGVNFSRCENASTFCPKRLISTAQYFATCRRGPTSQTHHWLSAVSRDSNTLREWELGLDIYNGDSVRLTGANLTRARSRQMRLATNEQAPYPRRRPGFCRRMHASSQKQGRRLSWGDSPNADLTLADFKGADLSHAKLSRSQLSTQVSKALHFSPLYLLTWIYHINPKGATLNGQYPV